LGFGGGGPSGCVGDVVVVVDLGGGSHCVGCGSEAVNAGDFAMAVAEVSVAGLVGVGGPGGAAFVGDVVVVDLLAGDDHDLLFNGGADEEALVDESVVAGGLAGFRGVGLDGEFDGVGPETGGVGAVVGVDCAGEVDGVVGFLVAATGEEDGCAAEGGCSDCGADLHGGLLSLFFTLVGCRRSGCRFRGKWLHVVLRKDLGWLEGYRFFLSACCRCGGDSCKGKRRSRFPHCAAE